FSSSYISLSPHRYAAHRDLHSFPTRRSSDLRTRTPNLLIRSQMLYPLSYECRFFYDVPVELCSPATSSTLSEFRSASVPFSGVRSEEHTSELQSRFDLVCRLLLE